jgi:nucleoside-diphosphate-sugar epimerase
MSGKKVIITGGTGMVGGCALRICLENQDVSMVTTIGRSRTGINNVRLREVVVDDFSDYSALSDVLENQNAALFCLGVYTGTVPDDLFRQITVDYTLAFARALHKASPQSAFCFLSGQGADQTEQSRMAFARYKGAAEKALLEIGFPRVQIFRPGYIYPVTPRKEPNLMYTISRFLYPLVSRIYPNIGISSEDLAAAMVHAGLYETGENENPVLENKEIRFLSQRG